MEGELEADVGIVSAFPPLFGEASSAGSAVVWGVLARSAGGFAGEARPFVIAFHQGEAGKAASADGAAFAGSAVGVAGFAGACQADVVAVLADGALEVVDSVALDAVGYRGAGFAGGPARRNSQDVVEALPAVGAAGVAGKVEGAHSSRG